MEAGGRPLEATGGLPLLEAGGRPLEATGGLPLEGAEPGRLPPSKVRVTAIGGGRVNIGAGGCGKGVI